jgi:single-strand DNA-binding protein
MNNLNSVLVEGILEGKPALQDTNGKPSCAFTIASNRYHKAGAKTEKETSAFEVEAEGKVAEDCHSLGREGRGVRVVGRLKQVKWTDAEGKGRSKIVIAAEHVEFRPL